MATKREQIKKYLPSWNKNIVWGIALVGGIAFALYYFGKKSATVEQFPVPGDPGSSPLIDDEKRQINTYVNEIHSNIGSSWNWLNNWDVDQLKRFLTVSDRIFIGVYNLYNSTHLSAPKTLKTEFESEMNYALAITDDYKIMAQIVARMNQIGLK